MRPLKRIKLTAGRTAVLLVAITALGGVAYAADGSGFVDAQGDINACVHPGGGKWHLWPPGHICSGGWETLTFPASLTAGPRGATGPTGPLNASASSVNGEVPTRLLLREATPASGTTSKTLYSDDGLTIIAECDAAGNATLLADGPASSDAELAVTGADSSGSYGTQTAALGPASLVAIGPAGSGEATFSYADTAAQTITGELGYQSAPSFGSYAGCAFFGKATAG